MFNDDKFEIHISEIFYYLMLLCLMGAKALGLSEGQWPFNLALICGSFLFVCKMFVTKYSISEWIANVSFIVLGSIVYLKNGHLELLMSVLLIIGIKNVPIKRAIGVAVSIWGILFGTTVIRALLGIYPGVISSQKKVGMDFGIVRYSLGFTHPNVLHITYFIISLMILFLIKKEKKNLLLTSFLLLVGNIYVFLYSMSYTGFLVVTFGIIVSIFYSLRKKIGNVEKILLVLLTAMCFLLPIFGQFVLPSKLAKLINHLINNRLRLAGDTFSMCPPTLFGNADSIANYGLNLDSSFAYILFYHGILTFILFMAGYIGVLIRALKNHDSSSIALLTSMALSGITEQYIGNLSFKNISVFFIGNLIYNREPIVDTSKVIDYKKLHAFGERVKRYFRGTPYVKCILPAVLIAVISLGIFNMFWEEPKHIYYVDAANPATLVFTYDESMRDELEIDDSIIVGKIYNGCNLNMEGWVDFRMETLRGRVSSFSWGFILGFVAIAFILNIKKLNSVYIEDVIRKTNEDDLPLIPSCSILGTNIAVTNMKSTVAYMQKNLCSLAGKYICVSNVHTTVTAYRDNSYRKVQNGAAFALPDGKPLSYVSRRRGYIQADRVAGPDLMAEIFRISSTNGYRHFFFGSTDETLTKLKSNLEIQYPGINIVGMYSPNYYRTVEEIPDMENAEHVKMIQEANPDFIWVGLGAPKQEIWMAKHEGEFSGVMLGVGAGFDFHAGTIKRAPKLMQALYLEWLYRLFQDPKRLIKRYISTNLSFIVETYKEGIRLKKETYQSARKRLLVYAHYYSPDVASTGQILTELSEGLLDTFDVTVIAVVPSYKGTIDEKYKLYRYYQQDVNGVKIFRVRVPEFTKASKVSRARNILSYYFGARKITKKVGPQDYVLSISQPPILGGLLGQYGKKKKNAKFIYNIQDFNPEQIQSVGYSRGKLLLGFMMYLDKKSCMKSDLIITVGKDLGHTIEQRFEGKSVPNYVVINNWINEKDIHPLTNDENVRTFREDNNLNGKFVFMYSGNIGLYYDLENLIKVIEKLPKDLRTSDGREVVFAFVGDGGLKKQLTNYVNNHNMSNVVFIPYQEKEKLVYSLNAGDVQICTNAKGIKGVSCPSKYYGIAAAGKPVLAVLEEGTEIHDLIETTKGGMVFSPEDYDNIAMGIVQMINIPTDELANMGNRGREYLLANLTKDISVEKYKKAILSL